MIRIYSTKRKEYSGSSRIHILKLTMKDFFSRNALTYSGRAFAAMLAVAVVLEVSVIGIVVGAIFQLVLLRVFCVLSGLVFGYFLVKTIIDTTRSIEEEGLKTTIKMDYRGVISLFVFLMFLYSYSIKSS